MHWHTKKSRMVECVAHLFVPYSKEGCCQLQTLFNDNCLPYYKNLLPKAVIFGIGDLSFA